MHPPVKHASPPLPLVAGVHLALFVAALAVTAALAGGAVFPSPFDPARGLAYFQAHAGAARVGSFFLCGAAIPLGVFAATAASRLTFLGVRVAGVSIGLLGGVGAAWLLLLSGLCMWALGQPGLGSEAVRVLHLLAFASGGPGFVLAFGIFVLGVSLAGGLTRNLPRGLMWFGVVVGVLAELSSVSLLSDAAAVLLPLARFPGLIWMLLVGVFLPRSHRAARATSGSERAEA
jgi:hypothetical protein